MSSIDALRLRKVLGRERWGVPRRFGPDGWILSGTTPSGGTVIVTVGPAPGSDEDWLHASISFPDRMPSYEDLTLLHRAVWADGWAYQCFAPAAEHVNIHEHALHLFGRPDGKSVLPNFGALGTI